MSLLKNIRFYVLLVTLFVSLALYVVAQTTSTTSESGYIKLTKWYGLVAIFYLYIVLLIGPFLYTFSIFPKKIATLISNSRRALGVSVFYFALLHGSIAFFGQLGGFPGLFYLSNKYLFSIGLGFIALLILFLLTITSFDYAVKKMKFQNWKKLQKLIYVAGFVLVIHVMMLGSDFAVLNSVIPQLSLILLFFLLFLEAHRIDFFVKKKFTRFPRIGIATSGVGILLILYFVASFSPQKDLGSINIHATHLEELQKRRENQTILPNIPNFDGDSSKWYAANIHAPKEIPLNTQIPITFDIYDGASGDKITNYKNINTKPMHLVITDDTLTYFAHVHPTKDGDQMKINTQFAFPGLYHLYINYQPLGGVEQQARFVVPAGNLQSIKKSTQLVDTNYSKNAGNYTVTLNTDKPFNAKLLDQGKQLFKFKITDRNGKDVKNLKPYLGAFGHLVMINQETYDYLHVHPTSMTTPKPNENGGPIVEFMPLGLYNTVKPGTYRLFAEFNPDNNLIQTDYTIKVE